MIRWTSAAVAACVLDAIEVPERVELAHKRRIARRARNLLAARRQGLSVLPAPGRSGDRYPGAPWWAIPLARIPDPVARYLALEEQLRLEARPDDPLLDSAWDRLSREDRDRVTQTPAPVRARRYTPTGAQ